MTVVVFFVQLNNESEQQTPVSSVHISQNASVHVPQSPNLQQTLITLRTTITKRIPFRRGRSGPHSVVLPSPDSIDDISTSSDMYEGSSAFATEVSDEQCRVAAAVILDSCGTSRLVERSFGTPSSECDSIPSSILATSLSDAEQQNVTTSEHKRTEQKRTSKRRAAKARQLSQTISITDDTIDRDEDDFVQVSQVTNSYSIPVLYSTVLFACDVWNYWPQSS